MPSTTQLPGPLHQRILAVARRVHRLHLLRGASVLVLALATAVNLALLTDLVLRESLPAAARAALLAGWAALGVVLSFGVLRALFRRLDPADLAAVIEQKYPELGERLTTSVELSRHADEGNGSPALIAILVQETEARTRPLDFGGVISGRSTGLLTTLAAIAFAGALAPAALAPGQYSRLAQRFFLPWKKPAPLADYRIDIEPGDVFAARGRPLTVAAQLTPRHSGIALPRVATLVLTGADGSAATHEMIADAKTPGRYAATFRVLGDARYQAEAGNAASESHALSAVTPVDLAPDNPTVTVTPPTYAAAALEPETFTGLVEVTALQHSAVRLRFGFTRPAVSARLVWECSKGNKEGEKSQTFDLPLAEDKTSAEFSLALKESGSYRLILEAEHGVVTERDGGALTARPDQPPAVLKFVGQEGARPARAYDRLPLEVRLADDIAVAGAELEYRVNDEKAAREERLALDGAGSREAVARHLFALAGKVKTGDEVYYRIRCRDNLPKEFGGPHVCYYPADGWLKLQIVAEGGSLKEQEILARRDALNKRLDEIRAELKHEQRRAMSVRAETREDGALNDNTAEALADIRRQNQATEKALGELARDLAEAPGEQKLADLARDVAGKEMRRADDGLRDALDRKADPDRRDRRLNDTEEELNRALAKLDRLREANEQLARERLDQAKIEALADRQRQLAEKAAELANKHPVQDPEAKQLAEQIRREQEEVSQELKKLAESSPALKKALEDARAEQVRQAGEKARQLAQAQRDVANASAETEKGRDAERMRALDQRQQDLAKNTEQLAKDTALSAKANFSRPLELDATAKAAESLKKGEPDKALQQQDRAARELDRLSRDLERGAEMAKDPKAAARQLARLEEDLARRTREQGAAKGDELRRDQEAIRKAAEGLSVPPKHAEAQAAKQKATEALAQAEKQLAEGKPQEAAAAMDKARQALRDLSAKIPATEERLRQAREEVAKMQKEQEEIARKAQDRSKQPEAARKQEELAQRLGNLDTPNAETRRDRAREAAKRAEADLRGADNGAVAKSQEQARRELERLAQQLAGQKSSDEKVADLARRQEELARRAGADDLPQAKRDEIRREQRQLADEAQALEAKGSEAKQRDASAAARQAADQAKVNPNGKSTRQAMADAAKKLDELAREMRGGQEAPKRQDSPLPNKEQAEAARRLAQEQRELREATQRAQERARNERRADSGAAKNNPAAKLAREQADIANDAAKLAKDVAREQGEQSSQRRSAEEAGRSTQEASRNLDSGALERAKTAGERSAEQLRRLANELAKTPRGKASPKQGDTLEQARRLAQRQEGVNKQLAPTASDRSAQRAQQQARQEQLTKQAQDLMRQLDELSKPGQQSPAQSGARDAARSARSAEGAMQAAQATARKGDQPATQAQRESAARHLDQAARQAEQGGRESAATPSQEAGQAMQEARGQMRQARDQMNRNQPGQAGQTMQQAARSLERAAEQLARAMEPDTQPSPTPPEGARGGGAVDGRTLPGELAPYTGKRWGELPGEVRTKVVQQMKARYGEDYARMIKLYFEQIADTKRKK
jgi:hypothetical protein